MKMSRVKRALVWRPRFSLWALLVLITVVAIPLGYMAQRRSWNLRRAAAFDNLLERGLFLTNLDRPLEVLHPIPAPTGWWPALLKEGSVPPVKRALLFGNGFDGSKFMESRGPADIGDAELLELAYFPEIEQLEIWHSERITDAGLRVVGRLPNLKVLSLESCPKVKGEFLLETPHTETIQFCEMNSLSTNELRSLSRLPNLKSLEFIRCEGITRESIDDIGLGAEVTIKVVIETKSSSRN